MPVRELLRGPADARPVPGSVRWLAPLLAHRGRGADGFSRLPAAERGRGCSLCSWPASDGRGSPGRPVRRPCAAMHDNRHGGSGSLAGGASRESVPYRHRQSRRQCRHSWYNCTQTQLRRNTALDHTYSSRTSR
jgi:hypothetical protein